ncbi:hypothetical protein ISCGN_014967 [Ixodes scapularis]
MHYGSGGVVKLPVTCLTCSVLTLSAISCDRFIAIMFPLQAHVRVTKQRTSAVIGVIWLASAAISVPLIVFSRLYTVSLWLRRGRLASLASASFGRFAAVDCSVVC